MLSINKCVPTAVELTHFAQFKHLVARVNIFIDRRAPRPQNDNEKVDKKRKLDEKELVVCPPN